MAANMFEPAIHKAMQSRVNKSAAYSRLALLTYDLILSASREKELIWQQKFRLSSVIYFFLRYPVIAFQVFNVFISHTSEYDCDVVYRATWALSIIVTRVAITASFMLRVYAIMGLSRKAFIVAALLGMVGASAIGLDAWQDVQVSCSTVSNPLSTVLTFFLLAAFDALTTSVLAFYAIKVFSTSGLKAYWDRGLITSLLLSQGLIYFIVVTVVQVLVIVLYYLPQGVYSQLLNNYALLLSSILLSRFLLDLREMYLKPTTSTMSTLSQGAATLTNVDFGNGQLSRIERQLATSSVVRDFQDPVVGNDRLCANVKGISMDDLSEPRQAKFESEDV